MNLQFLLLSLLSDLAFSATLFGIKERRQAIFFDLIALGSLFPLMPWTLSLALNFKMWI